MYRVKSIPQTVLLGALTGIVSSLPLVVCRGVGLIDFMPESIPGALLGSWLNLDPKYLFLIFYLAAAAVLALIFRAVLREIQRTGWMWGMALGIIQWAALGIIVAIFSDYLPDSPLLLPAESPTGSLYGLICFLMILFTSIIFGITLGLVLLEEQLDTSSIVRQSEAAPGPPRIEMSKAA